MDRAAQVAEKHKEKHPARVADAQFSFFPLDPPRFTNPGSLGFCHAYNRPAGNLCKADHHSDTEFPGVTMCMSQAGIVRVHGCLWCGSTTHARPQCQGPSLPASQVQMTLAEWQRFEPQRMKTFQEARDRDLKTYQHKDG